MKTKEYKYPEGRFKIDFNWREDRSHQDHLDLYLDYRIKELWIHFGMVCTENNKYVWGDGCRNFGESLEDAKNKLERVCAESVLWQVVYLREV